MRSSELLVDFITYCHQHPDERFWQALRNWSGYDSIKAEWRVSDIGWHQIDTFHFEGKRHDG